MHQGTDVLRLERHDTHRIPVASDELHLVGFVVAMHEDDRVDNANQEAMLRERSRKDSPVNGTYANVALLLSDS